MRSVSFGVGGMCGVAVVVMAVTLGACGGEEAKPPVMPTPAVEPAPTPPVVEAPKEEPKPAPTMAELQKATSTGIGMAMNAHDAKKMASFYTENAVLKMPGMPDLTGRDAIAGMWQHNFDMSSNSKGAPMRVFVKGDVVVVEFAWAGTHTGDMGGMKATEKPIGATGVDIMWFSPDGLVKEQHTYMDQGTIMSQLGAIKQKGRPVPTVPTAMPTAVVATGSADEQKNVDAATKMFAAFEKKSSDDFMGGASDDITWDDMTQPESMKGKAAGKKYFNAMTTAFPDVKATTQNAWGVGDVVIAEGTITGTQKGAFFGIPATKKPVSLHGVDIMQFKDGKIVSGRSYGNGAEMMTQLGLMPQPGAAKDAKPAAKADAKGAPAGKTDAKPAMAPAKK
jgi:steroid delta-isomerase-like uncharacterized protein